MKVVEEKRRGQMSQEYWKDDNAGFIRKGRKTTKIQLLVLQVCFSFLNG